ncbi:hypothetical protein [Streptomyces sp. NPDC086782]
MPSYASLVTIAVAGVAIAELSGTRTGRRLGLLVAVTAWVCLMSGVHW